MHRLLLIFCIAGLAGGCASRLPVQGFGPIARSESPRPAWSAAAFQETVDRLGDREACFLRCAAEGEGAGGEVEEERYFNEVGLFLGYTFERGEGGATVGLDYVRQLVPERIGVGAFVDLVFGDVDALAVGAGVWVRPFREIEDLTFVVAPGIDLANEEEEAEHGHEGEGGTSWEAAALLRLGVLYGFDLGAGYRFVPAFYVDIIFPDKAAYVMGVGIGKEF